MIWNTLTLLKPGRLTIFRMLAASVKSVVNQYHKRISTLEEQKYDLEYEVARKDFEVIFQLIKGWKALEINIVSNNRDEVVQLMLSRASQLSILICFI